VISLETPTGFRTYFVWFQLISVYVLMECALWSPRLEVRNWWALAAAVAVVFFVILDLALPDLIPTDLALHDRPSAAAMGLGLPAGNGSAAVLAAGVAAAIFLILVVRSAGGAVHVQMTWPYLRQALGYLLWAIVQEFILLSFFYTRGEELFGSRTAVWVTATLFAAAHLPSPLLTTFTFIAALFFCEMFRRYRSIYPIAVVHALLGLTVALSMPDSLLHHMRVGIGYLQYQR
jgi:membrane protease YdiL (CAAX protease family)